MEKEKDLVIVEFLQVLRSTLTNRSIYSEENRVFIKSLEELKVKVDNLLSKYGNLQISVAPHYLLTGETRWEEDPLYEELAHFFHYRNIKSVQFSRGLGSGELKGFVSQISRLPKDILADGGMAAILKGKHIIHLVVEMLDYAQILKGTKKDKDIWSFLLRGAMESRNFEQINAVAREFHQMIADVGIKAILEDDKLISNISGFLNHLYSTNQDIFVQCGKMLLEGFFLGINDVDKIVFPEPINQVFKVIPISEIKELLLKELFNEDTEDLAVLELCCQFIHDEAKHHIIANGLLTHLGNEYARNPPRVDKILNLFGSSQHVVISKLYTPHIETIKNLSLDNIFYFDHDALPKSYENSLLNMLQQEKDKEPLRLIISKISDEWDKMVDEKKIKQFKTLNEVIKALEEQNPDLKDIVTPLHTTCTRFIERIVLDGSMNKELEPFMGALKKGAVGKAYYLDKIFSEYKTSYYIFKLFFRIHTDDYFIFIDRLALTLDNPDFLLALIKSLEGLSPFLQYEVLKTIFKSKNVYVQIEVVKRMGDLPISNKDALFNVLENRCDDIRLKVEVMHILMKREEDKELAIKSLLLENSRSHRDNNVLKENIKIIGLLDLRAARHQLQSIKQKCTLFEYDLRKEVTQVLNGWDHGES